MSRPVFVLILLLSCLTAAAPMVAQGEKNLSGFVLLSGTPGRQGGGSFCDPSLLNRSESPLFYRLRGDRCEGLYAQQVSALSIDVRSILESFGPFDAAKDPKLVLTWKAPPGIDQDVRIRAFSFKSRTYFRMDTAVAVAHGFYQWPTDVLAAVDLGHEDLGVLAWIELPGPGGISREVYLPLRIGTQGAAAEAGYQVAFIPSQRLKEVRISVSRLDSRGEVTAVLRRDEELGYGYYPSGQRTVLSTGKLGAAGFYRLKITAMAGPGLSVDREIDFYHDRY